jgi:hypothetical protein
VRKTFDILVDGDDLLQVLVLAVAEDGVVDDDAVDFVVVVCVDEGVFEEFAVKFAELECEPTISCQKHCRYVVYVRQQDK